MEDQVTDDLNRLMEMGFTREAAENALILSEERKFENALAWLLEAEHSEISEVVDNTAEEAAQPPSQDNNENLPPEYREIAEAGLLALKVNQHKWFCLRCSTETSPGEGVILKECLHLFCRPCLSHIIRHEESALVKCPFEEEGCPGRLRDEEIKILIPPHEYKNFLQRAQPSPTVQEARDSNVEETPVETRRRTSDHQEIANEPVGVNPVKRKRFVKKANEPMSLSTESEPSLQASDHKVIIKASRKVPTSVCPKLRPVIIDGENVALEHGNKSKFSGKGLLLAIDYFLSRGHKTVHALLPRYRRYRFNQECPTVNSDQLDTLENFQLLIYTPSRRWGHRLEICDHRRLIVEVAVETGGVIISNDDYHYLVDESPSFKETIKKRIITFCFVDEEFLVSADPLGRHRPKLDSLLNFT